MLAIACARQSLPWQACEVGAETGPDPAGIALALECKS
jgi:hypothetical protein